MGEPVATIVNGKLLGKYGRDYKGERFCSFQGIPYAKPPIGKLRFKAPRPAESWHGMRDARKEGSMCFSRHPVFKELLGDEDCLFLNVYTPELYERGKKLKAVMVWIHGGGFTSGSSSSDIYGPEFLVAEDIVLVTINYRTGILGFLSLDDRSLDVPGNAGLKDMVMALKWIQKNIRTFCGDPKNVTIFGESAGAAAVHYLVLSPLAKGLFHKAVLQSGCALNLWAKGRRIALEMGELLGLKTMDEREIFKVLQEMPLEELQTTAEKLPDVFVARWVRPHGPVVERHPKNAFLPDEPINIIKSGRYNKVPILAGYTTREGMLSEILQRPKPFKPITNYELSIPHFLNIEYGSDLSKAVAQKIKEFYYGNKEPSVEDKDTFYLIETDNFFLRDLIRCLKLHLDNSPFPIYLYRMSLETDLNLFKKINEIPEPGVSHADDIGYLFNNLMTEVDPGTIEELSVQRFTRIWSNFAKYGHPTVINDTVVNVDWKPIEKNQLHFVDLGRELMSDVNPETERLTFWDEIINTNTSNCKL